ncbi:unnamed protein product [Cunninghamella echinulata]
MRLLLLVLIIFLLINYTSAFPQLSNYQVLLVATTIILTLPPVGYVFKEYHSKEVNTSFQQQQQVQLNTSMNVFTNLILYNYTGLPYYLLPIFTYTELPTCTYVYLLPDYLKALTSEMNQTCESGTNTTSLVMVNNEFAKLYNNLSHSQIEHPDQPEVMNHCIDLVPQLQNSNLEYNTDIDGSSLVSRPSSLQNLVSGGELALFYWECILISDVNDMCVFTNATIVQPSNITFSLLYVYGFNSGRDQCILKKTKLIDEFDTMSSFILYKLIPTNSVLNHTSYLRRKVIDGAGGLNGTNIYPQGDRLEYHEHQEHKLQEHKLQDQEYQEHKPQHHKHQAHRLTCKMGSDTLKMYSFNSKGAIVPCFIKEYPEKLIDLILDHYAVEPHQQCNVPKQRLLEDVKLELKGSYNGSQARYTRSNMKKTFNIITGKTKEPLREGSIVLAEVVYICGPVANCVLNSRLNGPIYVDNEPSNYLNNGGGVVTVGQTLYCNVESVDRDKLIVEINCKTSVIKSNSAVNLKQQLTLNEFYNTRAEKEILDFTKIQQKMNLNQSNRALNQSLFQSLAHTEHQQYRQNLSYALLFLLIIIASSQRSCSSLFFLPYNKRQKIFTSNYCHH